MRNESKNPRFRSVQAIECQRLVFLAGVADRLVREKGWSHERALVDLRSSINELAIDEAEPEDAAAIEVVRRHVTGMIDRVQDKDLGPPDAEAQENPTLWVLTVATGFCTNVEKEIQGISS